MSYEPYVEEGNLHRITEQRNEHVSLLGDVNSLLGQLLPPLDEKEFAALAAAFRICTFETEGLTPEWLEHGIKDFFSRSPEEAKGLATQEEWEAILAKVKNFDRLDALGLAYATAKSVGGLDSGRVEALAVQAAGQAVAIRYRRLGNGKTQQ